MRFLPIITTLLVVLLPASSFALTWEESVKAANAAYNRGEYDAAAKSYVAAIQKEPRRASPYRNLARTLFWLDRYSESVVFYDNYLRIAEPDMGPSVPAPQGSPLAKDDIEQVKSERKLAASRSADDVWMIPEAQRMAQVALQKEIDAGRIYTQGGGGAWALYQTLLRTGYAQPELANLRSRLTRALLDQFEAEIMPSEAELMPQLDLELWQLQGERLGAAREVSSDPAIRDVIQRRSAIVETAIALLTNQPEDAARLAAMAREKNPDMKFVAWYEIVSLTEVDQFDAALEAITAYARVARESKPAHLPYIQVVRAMILQRMGRPADAAELYMEVVK